MYKKSMQLDKFVWYYQYANYFTYVCQLNLFHCKTLDKSNQQYLCEVSRSHYNWVGKPNEQ